jgi:hypothetical protein
MGTLRYDGQLVEFDDDLLAHLQVVIIGKLRRGESFLMSWRDAKTRGNGRSSIWIHPAHRITFHLSDDNAMLSPRWLDQLTRSANSSTGLVAMRELSSDEASEGLDVPTT